MFGKAVDTLPTKIFRSLASPISNWPYDYSPTSDGNPPAANTSKTNRPRSATIVLTRIDGGVIGTDFTLY